MFETRVRNMTMENSHVVLFHKGEVYLVTPLHHLLAGGDHLAILSLYEFLLLQEAFNGSLPDGWLAFNTGDRVCRLGAASLPSSLAP